MEQNKEKILLHACCGICSGYPISVLKDEGYIPMVYFCNPNLDTKEEYERRLNAQQIICNNYAVDLVAEPYNHETFLNKIIGLEQEPEKGRRCEVCISLRLYATAKKAKSLGITSFTTSLPISPHKDFDMIKQIGLEAAKDYAVQFIPYNWKKQDGFLKTNKIANDLEIYRQKYCGCEFAKSHLK